MLPCPVFVLLFATPILLETPVPDAVQAMWEIHDKELQDQAQRVAGACDTGEIPQGMPTSPWTLECRHEGNDQLLGLTILGTQPVPRTRNAASGNDTQVAWPSSLGVEGIDVGAEAPFDGGTARLWFAYPTTLDSEEPGTQPSPTNAGSLRVTSLSLRGIERSSVEQDLERYHSELAWCYERRRMTEPQLSGSVGIQVEVGEATATVATASGSPEVDRCLAERLSAIAWGEGGSFEVRLSFSPE